MSRVKEAIGDLRSRPMNENWLKIARQEMASFESQQEKEEFVLTLIAAAFSAMVLKYESNKILDELEIEKKRIER